MKPDRQRKYYILMFQYSTLFPSVFFIIAISYINSHYHSFYSFLLNVKLAAHLILPYFQMRDSLLGDHYLSSKTVRPWVLLCLILLVVDSGVPCHYLLL